MAGKSDNCDNCYNRHITNVASHLCSFCDEYLCSVCTEHHQASKLLKSHPLLPISDFYRLPHYFRDISNCCKNHEKLYQLYCHSHEQFCCLSCVKQDHNKCENIEDFSEVIKDVKASPAFQEIESCLETVIKVYDNVRENRMNNKRRLSEQKENIMAEVRRVQKTIIDHLENLITSVEIAIATELETAELIIEDVLNEVEDRRKNISKLIEEKETVKELSTDHQAFLRLPYFQDRLKEETNYLEILEKENRVDEFNLVFESKELDLFCKLNDSFGTVSISKGQSQIDVELGKSAKAQISLPKIGDCDLLISNIYSVTYPEWEHELKITGCTILPSGQFVFVDNNSGQLFMVKGNGSGLGDCRNIVSVDQMWGVTLIGDNTVAVSENKELVLIDLLMGEQLKTIAVGDKFWGLEFINGKIIVRTTGMFLTIDADTENVITQTKFSPCSTYVASYSDRLFGSSSKKGVVYCCNTQGEELWQFRDENLKGPRDLTTDGQGFVYVVGKESNNVVVISPDGKTCKEILNSSHGIDNPRAIHFEKNLRLLLVCNEKNGAVVCNIG